MTESEILGKIVRPSIERANNEMPNFNLPSLTNETPLYGVREAVLDSLNLVSFVFIIEEEFQKMTGKSLKITTQDLLNSSNPPFKNLLALSSFLKSKL